jgi:hypothetical protein
LKKNEIIQDRTHLARKDGKIMKNIILTLLALVICIGSVFAFPYTVGTSTGGFSVLIDPLATNYDSATSTQDIVGVQMDKDTFLTVTVKDWEAAWEHELGYFLFDSLGAVQTGTETKIFDSVSASSGDRFNTPGFATGSNIGFYINAWDTLIGNSIGSSNPPDYFWTSHQANADGDDHVTGFLLLSGDRLQLAWEDLPMYRSDHDYNDVVIQVGTPLPLAGITFGITSLLAGPLAFFRRKRS